MRGAPQVRTGNNRKALGHAAARDIVIVILDPAELIAEGAQSTITGSKVTTSYACTSTTLKAVR